MRDLVSEAIHFAAEAFYGKKRKCGEEPAVLHSLEAAVIVGSLTDDTATIAAAVLHDVVEDAGVSLETLRERFGDRVAELVASETEDKRREQPPADTWRIRKEEAIRLLQSTGDIGVKMLFLGDKLSNIRSIRNELLKSGDAVWTRFNQRDPNEHYWYYSSVAAALSELKDTPAWQEYDLLIRQTFKVSEGR